MKTLLVFGISGFSGRAFERMFSSLGKGRDYRLVGVDFNLRSAANTGCAEYEAGDASDIGFTDSLVQRYRPEYIANFIGTFYSDSFEGYFRPNVEVTRVIFEAILKARLSGCRCLVVGSAAEYGFPKDNPVSELDALRPMSVYGLTKVYQTELALFYTRTRGLPVVVARTFNILGNDQSDRLAIGSFARQIEKAEDGGEIRVGDIETSRDYLMIDEVVREYWILLLYGIPGEVYNVCSGVPTCIRSVLDGLIRESGKSIRVVIDVSRLKSADVRIIYGDNSKYNALLASIQKDPENAI